jgi:ribosomal protein L11 methyltransferase
MRGMNKAENWKLTLPCTRQEAESLGENDDAFALFDPIPSIVTQEIEAFNDAKWELLAYFPSEPDAGIIKIIRSLLPSSAKTEAKIEKLPETDWLVESQQGLGPVHAGRFYVHTAANKAAIPDGAVPFHIEASQAFGTGGHETTSGCLDMLDRLRSRGKVFRHIADIGTGTGLLAFAAQHLWPQAYVTATDIDPISIDVTAYNAAKNNVMLGTGQGRTALYAATGTDHVMIQSRAPYDLVIANILAGPLIELAASFAAVMEEGGTLILAGLLNTQFDSIKRAYLAQGFRMAERMDQGDWPCLRLVMRRRYGWHRPIHASKRTSQPPGDFGTW